MPTQSPADVEVSLDADSLAELRARFRGALLLPGQEGYEETRRVWNGAIDRRPALIARCAGADDVAHALRFARERELPISVRAGGRSVAGHAVRDDALMIDLSLLKGVDVDPEARVARAAGGVVVSELDLAAQRHGLATTAATVGHVGIGGLTLGGGFGHLMRGHGLTVDNLRAVDLVTVEGERLRVDAEREPELFWGLRGGGGNFGIATAFEYDLHPVGPIVLGGPIYWPLDQGREVLGFLNEFAPEAPDELGVMIVAHRVPPLPFLRPEQFGTPALGLLLVWSGEVAEGTRAIAPLMAVGEPLGDLVRPVPYGAIQSLLDGPAAPGNHGYWKSHGLPELSDGAIQQIISLVDSMPTPLSMLSGWAIGGAVSRVPADATAVGEREVGFELRLVAVWPPGDREGEQHEAWVRDGWEALRPYSTGQYVGMLTDEDDALVRAAYGDEGFARLVALKDRYDPANIFRLNANIPPSGGGDRDRLSNPAANDEPETAQLPIPFVRDLADGHASPDKWKVFAYGYRTGAGIVGDPYVMHLPDASVTDRIFKPPSAGGLGLFPEEFHWRSFSETGKTLPFESGYPLKDSEVRWISKDDPIGIKRPSCGY